MTQTLSTRTTLGPVEQFPEGSCRIFDIGGVSVGVYNVRGTFYAVRNLCPHQLAPICAGLRKGTMLPSAPGEFVYDLDGLVIRCPRHGWEFDIRSGEPLFGIDRRKLAVFPVDVEEGQVVLTLRQRGSQE
jgi:nitrite reductase (NADH) small subunit